MRAWSADLGNVRAPADLDVLRRPWPVSRASDVLGPGGVLFLYGLYRRFGRHTSSDDRFVA